MGLIERPYNYVYSKNEIRYVFSIGVLTRPGLLLQVRFKYAKMDDVSFSELYTFEGLKPNEDGSVYVYLQAYINAVLSHVMPGINTAATDASDQACKFYIEYREITDLNPDADWNDTESARVRIALKGGIEKNKLSRNNIFINYIETQKPFLTWQPSGRVVFSDEPVYLTFLNAALAGFKIKVSIKATDGSTVDHVFDHSTDNKLLYHLFVSPAFLDLETLLGSGKKVYYYDVSIINIAETTTIINAMRLFVEYRPLYEYYDLVYHNSLTGIDSVRVCGDTTLNYDRTTLDADAGINVKEWNATTRTHEKYFSFAAIERKYKGNIGSFKTRTKEQQEAYMELFVSKSIYMKFDAWWVAVLQIQNTQDLGSRKNTTDGFPLEWSLSESNEVYTPKAKVFGLGTIVFDSACIAPSFTDGTPTLPDATEGVPYHVEVELTGTHPYTFSDYEDNPSWLAIITVDNTLIFAGTPPVGSSGTGIEVSITLNNCSGVPLSFTQTMDVAEAGGGEEGSSDAHFESPTFVSGDADNDLEIAHLVGDPGAVVTIKLDNLINTNGGTVQVNGSSAFLNQTWNFTLDGSGNGSFHADIYGNHIHTGSVILAHFTIIAVSSGSIGTPSSWQTSKVF